jgi:glutaredoxin-related protein
MNHLLEFYGRECSHCVNMDVLVDRLNKEENIKIEALEVWYNKENKKRFLEFDKDLCGGVPFFYNTKTNRFLCGEVSYQELRSWAKGE